MNAPARRSTNECPSHFSHNCLAQVSAEQVSQGQGESPTTHRGFGGGREPLSISVCEERREGRGRRSDHWRGAAIKPSRCGGDGRNNGLKGSADSERRPEFGRKMQGRGGKRWCPSFRHVSDELDTATISTRFPPESTKNSPSNAACIRWRLAHARCSLAGNTEPTNEAKAPACSARVTLQSVGKHVSLGNRTINRLTLKAEGR